MSQILVTRPVAQAEAFSAALRDLGFKTLGAPLLEMSFVEYQRPALQGYDGMIFTSANGVAGFDHSGVCRELCVLAVGEQTRRALEDLGYQDLRMGAGRAADLENFMVEGERYLYPCGREVSHVFPAQVDPLVVYEMRGVSGFQAGVLDAFARGDVSCVTLFSARTARQFATLVERYGLASSLSCIKVLLISNDLIEYVHTYGWDGVHVADAPNRFGMIEALKRIYGYG